VKKEQIFIVVAVIAVILLVSNLMSFGKINKLSGEVAQLNKAVQQKDANIKSLTDQTQVKQIEIDNVKKELDATKQKLTGAENELAMIKKDVDSLNKRMSAPKPVPVAPKPVSVTPKK